jgi:hypothetical protein
MWPRCRSRPAVVARVNIGQLLEPDDHDGLTSSDAPPRPAPSSRVDGETSRETGLEG